MATVRFSGDLKDAIIKAARGKMQAAIDRVEEARPSHDWGMRIYNNIFGDVIPKLNAMPSTVTVGQVHDMVRNYIRNTPAERHLPADVLISKAFGVAFPCKKGGGV